jgi:DNA polymerase-3 subunit delta
LATHPNKRQQPQYDKIGNGNKQEKQTLLHILVGQDDYSRTQSLKEIKKGIGEQTLLSANTTILDGKQVTLDKLKIVCETAPFLTERRLVIVNGLLERFETKSKSRRDRKIAQVPNHKNECKSLAGYITKIPCSTIFVLIDKGIKNNNPLFRELSGKAEVRSFPLLREVKLRQWVQRHVAEEGGSISPQSINLLTKLIGSNLWVMASEINKLILFTSGRRIEEGDVKRAVGYAQQVNVFAMVDAIIDSKADMAEQLLQQLLQDGAAPTYLLAMLSRQVHLVTRAKELKTRKLAKAEIQDKLGLTIEFAVRTTLEQANRYSWERLKQIYHNLLETDLSIKTGKYDGELALHILVAELGQGRTVI